LHSLVLIAQKYMTDSAQRLATPRVINLITDPQEREPVSLPHLHSWTATHFNRMLAEFHASLRDEPLTPDRRAPRPRAQSAETVARAALLK
jgi:arylsulfatase